jgi:serine phosphatase RsbU (regulator of sigma subunit)
VEPMGGAALGALTAPPTVRALLLEDDDGDAFLVEELLLEANAPVQLERVRTLAEARPHVSWAQCVLLDLGLPDADGLSALQTILELAPSAAVIVLTGLADESRGAEAVAMGAQDYLVKGQVDGQLLARAVRYAVERKRADESLRRLYATEIRAAENARLERGLLPTPITHDPSVSWITRYRPGNQAVLGGDFFDVVEVEDGTLHLLIGDVAGHGPDEAALGVCLRIAWRTLILSGREADHVLPIMDELLVHERASDEIFATVCTLRIAPDRRTGRLHVAGHPVPLLIDDGVQELPHEVVGPALGVVPGVVWGSREVHLPERWSLLLFTDGLVEGRVGRGADRLGTDGLRALCAELGVGPDADASVADQLVDRVERLNGGELSDDVALVLISRQATE